MPASNFTFFNKFSEDLAKKVHDLENDTIKVMLSNTAPNVATQTVKADITEIAGGGGYTSGGHDLQVSTSRTGLVTSVDGVNVVLTGTSGGIASFRYAYVYNDTPSSPADPLIGYLDYGSAVVVAEGETFTVSIPTVLFTIGQ